MTPRPSVALPRTDAPAVEADAGRVAAFLDAVAADGLELHSLVVWHRGAVVAEGFWRPYRPALPHMLHSAAKSITAAAVGLALGDGALRLGDRVASFFPEHMPARPSEHLLAMTVEDLLTMRTGHRTGISGGEWRLVRTSWVAAFLAEPVPDAPGETFIYSSGSSYMLSAIVQRVMGRRVDTLLRERVFDRIGMGAVQWDVSPEGVSTGGNGVSMTTADLVRFGVLHLQLGRWEGTQVLPEAWVDAATRLHVAHAPLGAMDGRRYAAPEAGSEQEDVGYGYQWWMLPEGAYRASGVFGQQLIVLPRHDAVVGITAGLPLGDKRLMRHVWAYLVPGLGAPAGAGRLAGLALPDEAGALDCAFAAEVDGVRWAVAPNEDGVAWVRLSFADGVCTFAQADAAGEHEVVCGLGHGVEGWTSVPGAKLHHQYEPGRMRVVASGAWLAPRRFAMTWAIRGDGVRGPRGAGF